MAEGRWRIAAHDWVRRWWRGEAGAPLLDGLLWPVEQLYRLGSRARNRAYDVGLLRVHQPSIPVVSVGNLSVGGAGKTPFAAWLVSRLREWGHRPGVVLRGYGEDEIQLHLELNPGVPVVVGRRRAEAVGEAAALGCDVAVVDDGFQHRALGRRLDLALVSADGWAGRRHLIPRGPWREGIRALRRASLTVVTRKSVPPEAARSVARELSAVVPAERIVLCSLVPTHLSPLRGGAEIPLQWLRQREVVAVASLADPAPFVQNLRSVGARVELLGFPDHHVFTAREAEGIAARGRGRPIVMTHKESVKLRDLLPTREAYVLMQQVLIEDGWPVLERALRQALKP